MMPLLPLIARHIGFAQVEDNLWVLRILDQEAAVQAGAVKSALESVAVVQNHARCFL
jgi:hypothetical protein